MNLRHLKYLTTLRDERCSWHLSHPIPLPLVLDFVIGARLITPAFRSCLSRLRCNCAYVTMPQAWKTRRSSVAPKVAHGSEPQWQRDRLLTVRCLRHRVLECGFYRRGCLG